MLLFRFKIIFLSVLAIVASCAFILWQVDLFNKTNKINLLRQQIISTSQTAFDVSDKIGVGEHTYEIINSVKAQKDIKDLWVSRSDAMSASLGKPKSTFRDQVERNVYISKSHNEEQITKIPGANNHHEARISIPVIATEKCVVCHSNIRRGDVVASVNATIALQDNILSIIDSMQTEFIVFVSLASLFTMFAMMFSVRSFTTLADSIKTAISSAINGDFTQRAKSRMVGTDEIAGLVNRLLESLDKNLTIIDTKIATIFIYNRLLYSKNPLSRLVEVIGEVTTLFAFKNKIEVANDTKEIYREIRVTLFSFSTSSFFESKTTE